MCSKSDSVFASPNLIFKLWRFQGSQGTMFTQNQLIDIVFVVAYVPKILLAKKFSCTCRWTQGRLDKGMFQKR